MATAVHISAIWNMSAAPIVRRRSAVFEVGAEGVLWLSGHQSGADSATERETMRVPRKFAAAGATVYSGEWPDRPVGTLVTGTNWFVCSDDHGGHVGGPHPNRWVKTEADNGRWGLVRDTDIYSETNPLPPCFQ
jgi:hypothetical protein